MPATIEQNNQTAGVADEITSAAADKTRQGGKAVSERLEASGPSRKPGNWLTARSASSAEELASTPEETGSQIQLLQQLLAYFNVELEAAASPGTRRRAGASGSNPGGIGTRGQPTSTAPARR